MKSLLLFSILMSLSTIVSAQSIGNALGSASATLETEVYVEPKIRLHYGIIEILDSTKSIKTIPSFGFCGVETFAGRLLTYELNDDELTIRDIDRGGELTEQTFKKRDKFHNTVMGVWSRIEKNEELNEEFYTELYITSSSMLIVKNCKFTK